MTLDMLTAAFPWPEAVPIGRAPLPEEAEADDGTALPAPAPRFDAASIWTAVMRRFRGEPPPTTTTH